MRLSRFKYVFSRETFPRKIYSTLPHTGTQGPIHSCHSCSTIRPITQRAVHAAKYKVSLKVKFKSELKKKVALYVKLYVMKSR